jgi:hypothetical protein
MESISIGRDLLQGTLDMMVLRMLLMRSLNRSSRSA